ncbi:hypothetical protein SKAU_G00046590 [Synaphobranchus kaupii]|uniref:Peptidase S72 domain-containing protein n=1 Tax=Synaphobranchus kaupii TaxID=118154 RepID=A0A9Q1G374_SYNKA|nr:hypothetical protein SKAU_G00046590 [Synaphobranchus kaupii]
MHEKRDQSILLFRNASAFPCTRGRVRPPRKFWNGRGLGPRRMKVDEHSRCGLPPSVARRRMSLVSYPLLLLLVLLSRAEQGRPSERPSSCPAVSVSRGLPDRTVTAGTAFLLRIPPLTFQGPVQHYQVSLADDVGGLPTWLAYSAQTGDLQGLALREEGGEYTLRVTAVGQCRTDPPVASSRFLLRVLSQAGTGAEAKPPRLAPPAETGGNQGCPVGESVTVAGLVLQVNLGGLDAADRLQLVAVLANYLRAQPTSIQLLSFRDELSLRRENTTVLAKGLTALGLDRKGPVKAEVLWPAGCGDFQMLPELVQVLRHNAGSGRLSTLLGVPVGGWRVLRRGMPAKARRLRWQLCQTPTPTLAIAPPHHTSVSAPLAGFQTMAWQRSMEQLISDSVSSEEGPPPLSSRPGVSDIEVYLPNELSMFDPGATMATAEPDAALPLSVLLSSACTPQWAECRSSSEPLLSTSYPATHTPAGSAENGFTALPAGDHSSRSASAVSLLPFPAFSSTYVMTPLDTPVTVYLEESHYTSLCDPVIALTIWPTKTLVPGHFSDTPLQPWTRELTLSLESSIKQSTTQPASSSMTTTVLQSMQVLQATVGIPFRFFIPSGTLLDPEDGRANAFTLEISSLDGSPIGPESWLGLDQRRWLLHGVPLDSDLQFSPQQLLLLARDSTGLTARLPMVIELRRAPWEPCYAYALTTRNSLHSFLRERRRVELFLEKVARFFNDSSGRHLALISLEAGSTVAAWYNFTLCWPSSRAEGQCPERWIRSMWEGMRTEDGKVDPVFAHAMLPEFPIVEVGDLSFGGVCLPGSPPATHPTTDPAAPQPGPSTWTAMLLVALLIICGLFLLTVLLIAAVRSCKSRGAPSLRPSEVYPARCLERQALKPRLPPLFQEEMPPPPLQLWLNLTPLPQEDPFSMDPTHTNHPFSIDSTQTHHPFSIDPTQTHHPFSIDPTHTYHPFSMDPTPTNYQQRSQERGLASQSPPHYQLPPPNSPSSHSHKNKPQKTLNSKYRL